MNTIENFLAALRRDNAPNARNALGITVAVGDQAYSAIATALEVTATPKTTDDGIPWAGPTIAEMIDTGMLSKLQPVTPAELSPEYHAGLASRMIERLDADARRLADAIAAERKQHKLTMSALYAELAGLKRVRRAYKVAGAVLQPVEPVAAVEVTMPADLPPYEECAASGAGHSFNSSGPTGKIQCDYCGKEAPEQFQRPATVDPARMTNLDERVAEEIPEGFEAVRDAEGKATGEVRPIGAPKPRRTSKPAARVDSGASGAVDMG